ncbi:hypothetical protein [Streptomyces ramulosus]|uniref:hypothetical protein n=1 Tax=Streptomyces TaxID=1883 RepID=UPI0031EFF6EE
MHDAASPAPSSPDPQPPSGPAPGPAGDRVEVEEAQQLVGAFLSACNRQLLLARRAGDQQRLEELKVRQRKCVEDQVRLRDAGPEEIARIAALYDGLLRDLEAPEA